MKHRPLSEVDLARELREELEELGSEAQIETPMLASAPEEQENVRWWLRRQRRHQRLTELIEDCIEAEEEPARKRLALLAVPAGFDDKVEELTEGGEIQDRAVAEALEQYEVETLQVLTAA